MDLASAKTRLPGRRIEWLPATGSTMTAAAVLARQGAPHGTIAGADAQSAGIGRHGRTWLSEPGQGLYVSFVLRLGPDPEKLPLTMLALGLAARRAIEECSGLAADLRWPNDVLLGGRKCCGVLAQMEDGAVIAGIGINVSQSGFPDGLETPATSLWMEGVRVSREDLLVHLANAVDHFCALPGETLTSEFELRSSYARGRRLRAEAGGRVVEGVGVGLDAAGFLVLREDNGQETTILAGGVRPV